MAGKFMLYDKDDFHTIENEAMEQDITLQPQCRQTNHRN